MKRFFAILIFLAMVLVLITPPPAQATVVVIGNRGLAMSLAGLSTDSKPTSYAYGSTYYETDTGVPYVYTSAGWVEDRRGGPNLTNLAALVHGATSKSTPVDADELALYDSVATALKKLTWVNLKATLKTYFDTLYCPATSGSSILKGDGAGGTASAVSKTDYCPPTSGSAVQKGDGAGGLTAATAGTDYAKPAYRHTPIASSATPSIDVDVASGADVFYTITALATNPVFTVTGTPVHGQRINLSMKDDGTPRTLGTTAFPGANGFAYIASLPIPTTTVASTWLKMVWSWNSTDSKWDLDAAR